MIRVTKEPEERQNELIDIAEALFMEKGYDFTTIEEIVRKAKIAKGTFYYYFKSKNDILDAMLDRHIKEIGEFMKHIALTEGMNALEKMVEVFKFFDRYKNDQAAFVDYIHAERNATIHVRMEEKFVPIFVNSFADVIKQGVQQGVFKTEYAREAALAILVSSIQFGKTHQSYVDLDERKRVKVAVDIIERILGMESGILLNSLMEEKK